MVIPPLCFLELRFRAVAPIRGLTHFHGAQWSALFRHLLKPRLGDLPLTKAGICVQPFETGIFEYQSNDPIHVCLTFPAHLLPEIGDLLTRFHDAPDHGGPLAPGRTISLEQIFCRVRRTECDPCDLPTQAGKLNGDLLADEIETMQTLETFHVLLPVPLRLTRPEKMKTPGHRYADENFFLGDPSLAGAALGHFAGSIRSACSLNSISSDLVITGGALIWVDIPYLNLEEAITKTIGGVCGCLRITGNPSPETAKRLVIGQYTGVGKNPSFGLGFYWIPELDTVRNIAMPTRGRSLLNRCLSVDSLQQALRQCSDSSPGPDGLTFSDLKKGGRELLTQMSSSVQTDHYRAGSAKKYRYPKTSGGYREIRIQNVGDRLIQKAAADRLLPIIDRFLSQSSFAYRAGLNRKGAAEALKAALAAGYETGIKADIAAFFDSVDLSRLAYLLTGLLPWDPLPAALMSWLHAANGHGGVGLPQGSPLSPVLSNLFLQRFDRDMEREGFRLIRYADDFVVLFSESQRDGGMDAVTASLYRLGLTLQPEKTIPVLPGKPVRFLGFCITRDSIEEDARPPVDETQPWIPVFRAEWTKGAPVYLTTICRGAYSSGAALVIKDEQARTMSVPWNRISRIVVVGRSPFSGGVVYRAVREEIPVSFVDIMGRPAGHLHASGYEISDMAGIQSEKAKDEAFRLAFGREIIMAKILNNAVLLRRNGIDAAALKDMARKAKSAESLDSLRGYEGTAARIYFSCLAELVKPFEFKGRVYHPPDGPVNVMLSFGYTLLYNRIACVLKDRGFNPRIGFFHQGRGRHLSLASDLLEEIRHVAERIVLALVHRREIDAKDFTLAKKKGVSFCRMEGEGFRKFIRRYETTMAASFSGQGGEKMTLNLYLDEMADRLKRSLKLDIPYQAMRID